MAQEICRVCGEHESQENSTTCISCEADMQAMYEEGFGDPSQQL